jgi:hypothetical protein
LWIRVLTLTGNQFIVPIIRTALCAATFPPAHSRADRSPKSTLWAAFFISGVFPFGEAVLITLAPQTDLRPRRGNMTGVVPRDLKLMGGNPGPVANHFRPTHDR